MPEKLDLFTTERRRKYLTPDERKAFIAAALELPQRHERTFALTLAHSGCRISEALDLEYGHIDMTAGQLVIRSLKKRNGKSENRAVPVPPDYLAALDNVYNIRTAQKRSRKVTQKLWPVSRMTGYRWIVKTMARAGIDGPMAKPHGLRHGFGGNALMKDIPLPLVQRWMGHADLETTSIYLQVVGNEESSFAGRLWE